jgi:hypothetical protein
MNQKPGTENGEPRMRHTASFPVLCSWFVILLFAPFGCGGQGQFPAGEPSASAERVDFAPAELRDEPDQFTFPADAGGKLLEERLRPPGHLPLAAPDFVRQPAARQSFLDRGPASPSFDLAPSEMRNPKGEVRPHQAPPRALTEAPSFADRSAEALPSRIELPAGAKAYVPAPDPQRPQALSPLVTQPVDSPAATRDPAAEFVPPFVFSAFIQLRPGPTAFQRVTLFDPLENERVVRLRHGPPEPLHVDSISDRPERPSLPVSDLASKKP